MLFLGLFLRAVFGFWRCFSVGETVIVAALVERVLVDSFSFFKGFISERRLFMDSGIYF